MADKSYYESDGSSYLNQKPSVNKQGANLPPHNHDERYYTREQQDATNEQVDENFASLGRTIDQMIIDIGNKADIDHIHPAVTSTNNGFMTPTQKQKLDDSLTVAPVTSVNQKTGAVVLTANDVNAAPATHNHNEATTGASGFMSASDKLKSDNVGKSFVHAYSNTVQAIPDSVTTKLNFDLEKTDRNAEFANSTFTAKIAGTYQLSAYIENAAVTGMLRMVLNLYKNNVEDITIGYLLNNTNATGSVFGTGIVELAVGDTLDLRIFANPGINTRARAGANYDYVQITKLF